MKSGGNLFCSPKKSRICVLMMMIAMPLVKPVTTGYGMYLMSVPNLLAPSTIKITPAIIAQTTSASGPCFITIGASNGTNAPAGPPICTREPPSNETKSPPMMAVKIPISGFKPDAIASAIESGSATMPTVKPAIASA